LKPVKTALVVRVKIALTALNAAKKTAFYLKLIRLNICTDSESSNTDVGAL
jgi:hypothetical protein